MDVQGFSRQERDTTCIHEAAHAVLFALGGIAVYRLAVAPLGAVAWRTGSRNGRFCSGLWGLCEKADLILPRPFLRWLMHEGGLRADALGYESLLQQPEGRAQAAGFAPILQQQIRAQMLGLLAGSLAEQLHQGQSPQLQAADDRHEIAKAQDLAWLLTGPAEFAHAAEQAEKKLREPTIWAQVATLAEALAAAGELSSGLRTYLPNPLPDWPPAPDCQVGSAF